MPGDAPEASPVVLVGELCSRIALPEPDPARWQEQFLDVCGQLRDQLLQYPGIAQATLALVPADLTVLRVGEALFALLLAGRVCAQEAPGPATPLSCTSPPTALNRRWPSGRVRTFTARSSIAQRSRNA